MTRATYHPLLQTIFSTHRGAEDDIGPWHLGGPQPSTPRRALAEIAIEAAERVGTRGAWDDRILAAARTVLSEKRPAKAALDRLRVLAQDARDGNETPAWYAGMAALHTGGGMRNLARPARAAITRAAQLLTKWRALELAVDVDDRLMKAEIHGHLDRRKIATRVSSLVYRAGDPIGNPTIWLVRTISPEGGESGWGTLYRMHGLHFTEGGRDDALAAIPDEFLEAAAAVVLKV